MKKRISILLLVTLLLNALCIGVAATGEPDYSQNLVLHYDFEGATQEEALKDKSTVGETSNQSNLTPTTKNTSTFPNLNTAFEYDLKNGTVTKAINGPYSLRANFNTGDFDCIAAGSATMFLRFKMDPALAAAGTNASRSWVVDGRAGGNDRLFSMSYYTNNGSTQFENILNSINSSSQHKQNNVINHTPTNGGLQDGAYFNYMITYKSAADGKVEMTAYVCKGDQFEEWTQVGTKTTVSAVTLTPSGLDNQAFCVLASAFNDDTQQAGVTMDDVRIYNTVLTKEAMSAELETAMSAKKLDAGIRVTNAQTNGNAVRFLALIDDLNDDQIGFDITAAYNDGTAKNVSANVTTSTAYTSVNAAGETKTAQELGGSYIVAVEIAGITPTVAITFTIKPYRLIGSEKVYGETVTYTYTPASSN